MTKNWMLKLRISVVGLLLWLTALLNIERIHEPINLASFVYILTALMATVIIMLPKLRKATLAEITIASLAVYVVTKWTLGYSFFGSHLPITVTELVVLCVTSGLACLVAHQIDEFMISAGDLAAVQSFRNVLALEDAESKMYDEVQRARRFERSLAVAAVSLTSDFRSEELDRLTHQARLEMARKYLETRVAQRLSESTFPGDMLVYHDGEFILMFPEANSESVRPLLEKVAKELQEQLGAHIQIGMAQFPDQECTLTGLIERAESESRSMSSVDSPQLDPQFSFPNRAIPETT